LSITIRIFRIFQEDLQYIDIKTPLVYNTTGPS